MQAECRNLLYTRNTPQWQRQILSQTKGVEKVFQANGPKKQAGVGILISKKIDIDLLFWAGALSRPWKLILHSSPQHPKEARLQGALMLRIIGEKTTRFIPNWEELGLSEVPGTQKTMTDQWHRFLPVWAVPWADGGYKIHIYSQNMQQNCDCRVLLHAQHHRIREPQDLGSLVTPRFQDPRGGLTCRSSYTQDARIRGSQRQPDSEEF